MKKLIKSEAGDKFEIDEELINEVSNSDEFKDVEITPEDVMDAIQAIDALADAVIDKADGEEKKIDADELLDQVRDMIDETHEDDTELEKEEELPAEITNSVIRVAVSDDNEIAIEKAPDEIYDSDIDGETCTVFDTDCDIPIDVEDTGNPDGDDLLIIGNSASNSYKKGYLKVTSSATKKAWSSAYKKVRKMIGNAKMTAAHWAIVSALAKKEEEDDKKKKKLECALLKKIRSDKEMKNNLLKPLKSSNEFDANGQPESETKPEETAGKDNPGFKEGGAPENEKSPEETTSQSGNPTEDPEKQVERENEIVLPEEEIIAVDVPLTNSKKRVQLKKVASSVAKGCNTYVVQNVSRALERVLDGKCVKSGKFGFMFKSSASGLLACCAKFVDGGKGNYGTVLVNGKICIMKGKSFPIFNATEKTIFSQKMETAFKRGKLIGSSARKPLTNGCHGKEKEEKNKKDEEIKSARCEAIRAKIQSHREIKKAQMLASQNEAKLRAMHDAEERERLFQSSQSVMNEEKIAIRQSVSRNASTLKKLYDSMF